MSGYDLPMRTSVADSAALTSTRASWHALAEHVLAPEFHSATGRIGLRRTPGGFGQPERVTDGRRRRVRVDGSFLVIDDDGETWHELTTLGAAAASLGLPLGVGTGVYEPSSDADPDTPLTIDAVAAAELADWFQFVDAALDEFRRRHRDAAPSVAQLWPEHFDLACSIDEVNYGGSPGDAGGDGRSEPYLYVGPWSPPPATGFWNEPYGAARSRSEITSVEQAIEFFEQGMTEARRG